MAIELLEHASDTGPSTYLEVRISGKLSGEDYEHLVPATEALIEREGKVRILMDMHDFHGWDLGALWADTKFAARHFSDIERLAMIGESKWEQGMATFCKPFTRATVRYFDRSEADAARSWIVASD
jgi:hypothetical protein